MTQVAPPGAITKLRPLPEFTDAQNNYFEQLELVLRQLWRRTGGESDSIVDTDIGFGFPVNIDELEANSLGFSTPVQNEVDTLSISTNHTTAGSEFLRVTAACTITLNTSPDDGELVSVQPDGFFVVTISGDINGDTELIMNGAYDLAELEYSAELGEWVIT